MTQNIIKTGFKTIVKVIIVFAVLIGLLFGVYYLISDQIVNKGNILNNDWKNGNCTITLDATEKTYSFDFDGKKESGKITKLEYLKDKSDSSNILYKAEFDGNGTYECEIAVNMSEAKKTITVSSQKFTNKYVLTEVEDEESSSAN